MYNPFQQPQGNAPFTLNSQPQAKDLPKLELELKRNNVEKFICEKRIERIKADIVVIKRVRLEDETNEYRRLALLAKIDELKAQIESEMFKVEICSMTIFMISMAIESVVSAEPEMILPYSRMHYHINSAAPEQFMAPGPGR
jgi:anti-sigma28 factor (negative regulator of flagellin synthesis)